MNQTLGRSYTAERIATVLGDCAKENVRKHLLRDVPAVRSRQPGGQIAKEYSLADLPRSLIARIESKALECGYRSAEHMLDSSHVAWLPTVNGKRFTLDKIDPVKVNEARRRRDALAPMLTKSGSLADREIARHVHSIWPIADESERTIRRWISLARQRDAGLLQWKRIELYLDRRPTLKERTGPHRLRRADYCRWIDSVIPAKGRFDELSDLQERSLFDSITTELCSRITAGETPGRAKLAVFRFLRSREVRIAKSEEGLRKRIHRLCSFGIANEWRAEAMVTVLPERLRRSPGGNLKRTGRRPLAQLSEEHRRIVQGLTLATDPNTGMRISVSMALRLFALSDKCPDDVADAILKPRSSKHTITPTLKRQARITPEAKMLHRGNKTFGLHGYSQPRGLFYINSLGATTPILAGDIFERDDMTLNQPWYVEWEDDGTDPCAAAFGVKLLRGQLLMQIDVGSQRGISFELLARPHDSYRADDIWAWIGRGYRDIGLPRVGERMERGIWEAHAIHGIPIAPGSWDRKVRLGGLGALGVAHIPSYSPHTKSIESFFNILQKVLGCSGVQVGRKRGEFEKATKDWMLCRAGKKHPAECGFLHGDELVKRIANAIQFLNSDPREGEVYKGIPDEIWKRDVSSSALRELAPDKAWIFYPVKRPAAIRSGMVRCKFAEHNCSYSFTNPEIFADLGRGHRVIVCFDPAIPDQGAIIFNAEVGSRSKGYRPGQQICLAELVDRAPQYCALDGFDDEEGYDRRRRFTAQLRKAYRAIALPGTRGASATVARNHRGNESRIESGCRAAAFSPSESNLPGAEKFRRRELGKRLITEARQDRNDNETALLSLLADQERAIQSELGILT